MTTTTLTAAPVKEICYDRETRDYAMYLDGELVGFARTYHEAEVTLDNLVLELLQTGMTDAFTATELDGGSDPDTITAEYAEALPIELTTPRVVRATSAAPPPGATLVMAGSSAPATRLRWRNTSRSAAPRCAAAP